MNQCRCVTDCSQFGSAEHISNLVGIIRLKCGPHTPCAKDDSHSNSQNLLEIDGHCLSLEKCAPLPDLPPTLPTQPVARRGEHDSHLVGTVVSISISDHHVTARLKSRLGNCGHCQIIHSRGRQRVSRILREAEARDLKEPPCVDLPHVGFILRS